VPVIAELQTAEGTVVEGSAEEYQGFAQEVFVSAVDLVEF